MSSQLRIGVSLVVLGLSSIAHAQVAAPAAPAVADTDSGVTEVGDIIVTAQRRGENLQRVPIAVSAVTADSIQAMGITTTSDISSIAPGLTFQTQIGNATPYIRGVGTSAAGSPGQENSVAIYVDGVYISAQSGGLFALNNIERIEVLKGPQSTLFGRNATGGLIQIITRSPQHDPHVEGSIGYGNYDTFTSKLYATTGLGENLAIDFGGSYSRQGDGWGRNILTGRDANKTPKDLSLRSKLLFTPSDGTRITLSGDYAESRTSTGVTTRTFPGRPNILGYQSRGGFYDSDSVVQPLFKVKGGGGSLKIEQDLDFAQLVSITAYRESKATSRVDFLSNPQPAITIAFTPHERQFTQEVQLLSPDGSPVKWIAGAFYYRNKGSFEPFESIVGPVLTGAPGPVINRITGNQLTNSISVFGQATFPLGETTRLTTGARYTRDKRVAKNVGSTILTFAPASPPPIVYPDRRQTSSKPTWRISLDQDIGPDALAYVSYNRGFKSGLFNLQEPTGRALRPEKIDAYEIGAKADLFDRMLRLNVAAFYYDYTNIQILRAEGGLTQLFNAASAKVYGLDLEGTLVPTKGLTLKAGLGLLHSRFGNFPGAVLSTPLPTGGNAITSFNAKGNHTLYSPDYTLDLSANYEHRFEAGTLGLTAGYYLSGRRYFEVDNRLSQKPYGLLSGELSWALPGDHLRARLWGRNLTKRKIYRQITEQGVIDGVIADAPRTYGVALDFNF